MIFGLSQLFNIASQVDAGGMAPGRAAKEIAGPPINKV